MKRSLITFALVALCASGALSAAYGQTAGRPFSVTITNNSNDTVYLAGFYNVKSSEPLVTQPVLAGSKNLVVTFDQKNDYYGRSVDLQKVTVRIGKNDWKTVTSGSFVIVEQKDVDQYRRKEK